jgi:acetyltransferase-like isoleucine patch superfamily enzyme
MSSRPVNDYIGIISKSYMMGNITCGCSVRLWNCEVIALGNVHIGTGTSMNYVKVRQAINDVIIGNYCSIGEGTRILEYNHQFQRLSSYYYKSNIFKENLLEDIQSKGEIVIEDDVWIGNNCIILSGVHIGRGAVIGAGSIVTHNVVPYSINAGNPSRMIKKRFSDSIIDEIEKTKWWDDNPLLLSRKREMFDCFEEKIQHENDN